LDEACFLRYFLEVVAHVVAVAQTSAVLRGEGEDEVGALMLRRDD
jgi:hypothetical protein